MNNMPRAVIAGGSGFLGSHLCDRLLAEGFQVVAIDNFVTGSRGNVSHLADNANFELIEQDIVQPFTVDGDVDYVYNMASPASPIDYLQIPLETLRVGSEGNMNLLELARATSLVSFGSIQTLLFPHFNTVAASLFWSLKNAINLYSFNYNNDKFYKGFQK